MERAEERYCTFFFLLENSLYLLFFRGCIDSNLIWKFHFLIDTQVSAL
jgi:hypothetical protein